MSIAIRRAALDSTIGRLYQVISFNEGGVPDWAGMRTLFAPGARLTQVAPSGVDTLDLEEFEAMYSEMLEAGALLASFEYETGRRVEMFGAAAHVLSAYESRRSPEARVPFGRGINSIQLIWAEDRWVIVSLLWDEGLSEGAPVIEPIEVIHGDTA